MEQYMTLFESTGEKVMESENKCPGCKRIHCEGCGIYRKLNTNKQVKVQFPPGFSPDREEGLGISFDVGTTTLGAMLWELGSGTLLAAETGTNPQAVFGTDVVSRILAAQKEENLKRMQKMLIEKLDGMSYQMAMHLAGEEAVQETADGTGTGSESACNRNMAEDVRTHIRKVTVAGNTVMCEILLGIKPAGLLKAPFVPDYGEVVDRKGKKFGFVFLEEADVFVLPPVGGYVGADALAVYHYVKTKEKGKKILTVDIGTNGEILLQCGKKSFACSAAAGPALEGGGISCGMRAVRGAVDMVALNGRFPVEDVVCRVIGDAAPFGICGSGLMDALSILLQTGVVDSSGYMQSGREARAAGAPGRIAQRITEGSQRQFLLTGEKHPVYLTARDVRQLQLSVSAIRSGMEVLLKKAELSPAQLDRIYLAGAFGCYIGIESGIRAGLFPSLPPEKICQAGNLAGTGAAMALLSSNALWKMEEESREIQHVELAGDEEFQELFLGHMRFFSHPDREKDIGS